MVDRDTNNQDRVLDEAVQAFLACELQGEKPDLDDFVKKYPGLESRIKQKLRACERVGSLFDSLREVQDNEFPEAVDGVDLVGSQIGPFKITEIIGHGGMGVVYKGHDSRLGREVAVKAMPSHLLADVSAQARFRREARLLASMSHPNIAVIHDIIEKGKGVGYMVLEYVPGQTLDRCLARGPMKVREALEVALQIAEAVAAAHKEGVIHRDLKPANIRITPEGKVKVLDFGLAKPIPVQGTEPQSHVTQPGRVIGTPAYMSPEQTRGKPADHRTDIWSFGCVLYVMLTGRLPFGGETTTDILARIIEREPDWSLLPQATPPNIRVLLRRCLAKDLNRRLQHIGDAVIELDETLNLSPEDSGLAEPLAGYSRRRLRLVGAVGCLGGMILGLLVASLFLGRPTGKPYPIAGKEMTRRFAITLPENQVLFFQGSTFANRLSAFALSPDGSRLVYVARIDETSRLFERRIGQFESRPIPGTEGASVPFFSPDGRSVGFFADEKLKTASLLGGEPVTLCSTERPNGGSWSSDDLIYFSASIGLACVPADGGEPERLLVDSKPLEGGNPQVLPGSNAVLVSSSEGAVLVLLETMEKKILVKDVQFARYVPSGHLIYIRAGAVEAVPFNPATCEVTGRAVPVLERVLLNSGMGTAQFTFSNEGLLVYAPGGDTRRTIPAWVDRKGNVEPLGMSARVYGALRLSPDSKRIAIVLTEKKENIYIYDIIGGRETRLTKEGNNSNPLWTPDGQHVLFTRQPEEYSGQQSLLWAPADGSSETEVLLSPGGSPWSWSPDGKFLALHEVHKTTGHDICVLAMEDRGASTIILQTEFTEWAPSLSPDGRWLAYSSNQGGGNFQIYIRPYPEMDRIIPISKESGEEPIWSRSGDELFYRNKNKWMVVSISTEPEFVAGAPQVLFEGPYGQVGGLSYDVSPDGQRFLVLKPQFDDSQVRELHVVTNWFEELKRLAPPDGS